MAEVAQVKSVVFPEFRKSLPRMDGKVVAITGCTSGTGFTTARTCAELGAHVVMLNRASQRANDALAKIKSEVPNAQVSLVSCDLMRFESVREAAMNLQDKFGDVGLDVLCNNAGIMATKDEATVDGFDTQMQTNHLSHFLLTAEFFPLLEKAANKNGEARVVNHSSGARHSPHGPLEAQYLGKNGGKLGGDATGCCNPFSGPRWKRYQQTKLANVVFTYALDDRIKAKGSKIKALVAHPGLAATNLQVTTADEGGMGVGFTNWLMRNFSQSGDDGTTPLLTCVCVTDVTSRQFYGPKGGMKGPPTLEKPEGRLADQASRDMLWSESQKATGITFDL